MILKQSITPSGKSTLSGIPVAVKRPKVGITAGEGIAGSMLNPISGLTMQGGVVTPKVTITSTPKTGSAVNLPKITVGGAPALVASVASEEKQNFFEKNKKGITIGGAILAGLVILYFVTKKKHK